MPVYDRVTEWTDPVRRLRQEPPLDLIAIDDLPSGRPVLGERSAGSSTEAWLAGLAGEGVPFTLRVDS